MNHKLIFEMIDCVKRECGMRKYVYPKRVAQGKMNPDKAEREQYLMEQVKTFLQAVYDGTAPKEVLQQTLNFGEG